MPSFIFRNAAHSKPQYKLQRLVVCCGTCISAAIAGVLHVMQFDQVSLYCVVFIYNFETGRFVVDLRKRNLHFPNTICCLLPQFKQYCILYLRSFIGVCRRHTLTVIYINALMSSFLNIQVV